MNDQALQALARQAGIAVEWTDYRGQARHVGAEVLRALLQAIGLPCATAGDLEESRRRLEAEARGEILPPLMTALAGRLVPLPAGLRGATARLAAEDGRSEELSVLHAGEARPQLPAIERPGYYHLSLGEREIRLAVAPAQCCTLEEIAGGTKLWGLAAQLYGLKRPDDGGIGDLGGAAALARAVGRHDADVLALSPLHALFTAHPERFSPYAPSSRLFLNPLYADPSCLFGPERVAAALNATDPGGRRLALEQATLIDWPAAAAGKLAVLRWLFDGFVEQELARQPDGALAADFSTFREAGGALLAQHACFEALHAARLAQDVEQGDWRRWPAELRDPEGPAVRGFAQEQQREVLFHCFLQWVAERSLAAAQAEAKGAGLCIGLLADLAVGTDPAGSHAWSRQDDMLVGLTVGAPPDLLNAQGQAWGLTTFSPHALKSSGFAPYLALLRATLRHVGGVRIDHVLGLRRLWLLPEGAPPGEGAYLTYPQEDLLRLIALESHRHRAVVIGEDLGTVPAGFSDELAERGILGLRVLSFQREGKGFLPPGDWTLPAAGMTSTHDLPTVAGWWSGKDIALRSDLGLAKEVEALSERADDRSALWSAFQAAGLVNGDCPGSEATPLVVDAAVAYVARSASALALIPLEDLLGLEEQPNLPGTIHEHPNWRRRLDRPPADLLEAQAVIPRLGALQERIRR